MREEHRVEHRECIQRFLCPCLILILRVRFGQDDQKSQCVNLLLWILQSSALWQCESRSTSPRDVCRHLRRELRPCNDTYDRERTGDKLINDKPFSRLIFFPAESCRKPHDFPVLLPCLFIGVVMPTMFIYSLATGEFPSPSPVSESCRRHVEVSFTLCSGEYAQDMGTGQEDVPFRYLNVSYLTKELWLVLNIIRLFVIRKTASPSLVSLRSLQRPQRP